MCVETPREWSQRAKNAQSMRRPQIEQTNKPSRRRCKPEKNGAKACSCGLPGLLYLQLLYCYYYSISATTRLGLHILRYDLSRLWSQDRLQGEAAVGNLRLSDGRSDKREYWRTGSICNGRYLPPDKASRDIFGPRKRETKTTVIHLQRALREGGGRRMVALVFTGRRAEGPPRGVRTSRRVFAICYGPHPCYGPLRIAIVALRYGSLYLRTSEGRGFPRCSICRSAKALVRESL